MISHFTFSVLFIFFLYFAIQKKTLFDIFLYIRGDF